LLQDRNLNSAQISAVRQLVTKTKEPLTVCLDAINNNANHRVEELANEPYRGDESTSEIYNREEGRRERKRMIKEKAYWKPAAGKRETRGQKHMVK
jgi:hypothetical protein